MPRWTIRVTPMIIIGLIIVSLVIGCSSTNSPVKAISIEQLDEAMRQSTEISSLRVADAAKLKKLYDISSDEVEDFLFYTAPSNLKADELLVLKLKSAADLSSIKSKIIKRVDKQSNSFKDYLPEEYYLIQKHIFRTNGSYVLLVISREAEKIAKTFDQILK